MKVSDYITSYLEEKGIRVVFGYIGGMITHLVDSIASSKVKFVQTYHEQTAAIAAEGYSKESDNVGVAISTSGPGATNMITGIADAYFDSIAVLFITGQVNTSDYKYDKPIRQQGFQETDVVSIVTPITKYAKFVDNPESIAFELDTAFYHALNGRKGPVLLDIPMDVQRAIVEPGKLKRFTPPTIVETKTIDISAILPLLGNAKRPMILIGAGCRSEQNTLLLEEFLTNTKIPVVTSLMGKGIVDESYPYHLGMVGSYGNRCANMGIANADLLIALGTRLDTRQTGNILKSFIEEGSIIHVDIDKGELDSNRLENRLKIDSDIATFLDTIIPLFQKNTHIAWRNYVEKLKFKYNQDVEIERFVENKSPYRFMQYLNTVIKDDDIVCADIGQNQMWAAQTLKLMSKQRFVTSGGLAPMGFSLPVAIGCSFVSPNKNIYSINGDGGAHMAMQSLFLISQYNLPIKVIILNNNSLGMITQFQHLYFNNRMPATTENGGYKVPEFKDIASAYNLIYYKITEKDLGNDDLMSEIMNCRNCIIEYHIIGLTTVSPKLEFDKPISKPNPQINEDEYNESMNVNELN